MGVEKFFKVLIIFALIPLISVEAKKIDFTPPDAIDNNCPFQFNIDNKEFSNIERIEIKVNKNKAWIKNLLNLHVKLEKEKARSPHKNWFPEFRITEKYKKKFKSKVYVHYKDATQCVFNSYVRTTGDLWWHLGWGKGTPISSMAVELLDGNIENITTFKLFLPEARYGSNEVFVSTFMKELGFLSPKTLFVKGKINGFTSKYIFQEDLRKEFLENSGFKEGPILEGDERFTISLLDSEHLYDKKTNLSKLVNKTFAKKNLLNLNIAVDAVNNLNKLYLLNHKANYPKGFVKNVKLNLFTQYFFENKNLIEELETYEALIYAIDATHSLSFDDRRFYYDSVNQSFLPIYYDGKSQILEKNQILSNDNLIKNTSPEAKKGSERALAKVLNINFDILFKHLIDAGVNISKNQLRVAVANIVTRLNILKNSTFPEISVSNKSLYFSTFNETETRGKKLVFVDMNKEEFIICNFKLEDCNQLKTNAADFKKYLVNALNQDFYNFKKNFKIKSDLIFVHKDLKFEYTALKMDDFSSSWQKIQLNESTLLYNKNIKVDIDEKKRTMSFFQKNKEGIALIKNGKLENWKIEFTGYGELDSKLQTINQFNLTGCLNFYNIELENIFLNSNNSSCEDAINFVNTKGNINNIEVNNSSSDAVDMDFSNVTVTNINIFNSLNDCLDLSYGNYIIKNLVVKNCGDKGLSVGEKSRVNLDIFKSENTQIAVASKDSASVKLNMTEIKNTKLCFAAYRKKQEFSGGRIAVKSSNCNESNAYYSKGSKIEFLK